MEERDIALDSFHNPLIQDARKNPRAIELEADFFTDRNKQKLFYRLWALKGKKSPQNPTIILNIHGMVSHSEPYLLLADLLVSDEIMMCGLDLPGHGYSEGKRGDYSNFQIFLDAISDCLIFLYSRFPDAKFMLCGESMGGLAITLYLVQEYPHNCPVSIEKALIWAPAYKANLDNKLSFKAIKESLGLVFRFLFCPHSVSITVIHHDTFRDQAALKYDSEDPHILPKYSVQYIWNIQKAMNRLRKLGYSKSMKVPFMIVHGSADIVVSQPESYRFYEESPMKDQSEYLLVPDSWHNVYSDPSFSPDLIERMVRFVSKS